MITIYVKRIRSYMHGFLRYRNNKVIIIIIIAKYGSFQAKVMPCSITSPERIGDRVVRSDFILRTIRI